MLQAVLFDLDDTLLANDMQVFLPHYLRLLEEHANVCPDPSRFLPALRTSTRAMMTSTDRRTNQEVFWASFEAQAGVVRAQAEAAFQRFYRDHFDQLRGLTRTVPHAREVVQHCLDRGLSVVIATNPVFPRQAIEARLRWAGLPPEEIPFACITCFDNMTRTKPNPAYYEEILQQLGVAPEAAVMVGNSHEADIEPAASVGLRTLWVNDASAAIEPRVDPVSRAPSIQRTSSAALSLAGVLAQLEKMAGPAASGPR